MDDILRVMTEEEFVSVLGPNWRDKIESGWGGGMEAYKGKLVKRPDFSPDPTYRNQGWFVSSKGWHFSSDCFINDKRARYIYYPCKCNYNSGCLICKGTGEVCRVLPMNKENENIYKCL